jgi:hypothetical protein
MIQVIINIVIVNIVIDSEANETFTIQLPIYSTRSEPSSRSNNYTWGQIQVISEPIFDQDNNTGDSKSQRIAVEGDKIYVVWRDNTNFSGSGGDYDIFFRYFNGLAWSEIQVISEPILGNNINTGSGGECAIAVENGKIYVVWMDDNNTNSCGSDGDIFFRCNITGQGWEDVQVISEPTFGGNSNTGTSMYPQLDVENGNIYVIWADNTDLQNSGTDQDLFFRCKPTASGWGPIEVPNEPVTGKNLNIDNLGTMRGNIAVENGDVHIVWSDKNNTEGSGTDTDVFYRSKITGKGWGDISPISEPIFGQDSNKDESWAPDIDVDNGEIYIIWRGYAPELGAGNDRDIFLRCNITGNNWEDIFVVSEPVQGQNTNKDMSNLLDDGLKVDNGNIYVTWDDRNNTNNAGNEMETFFRCYLNNRGWEPVKVISEPMEGQNNMSQNSLNANIAFDLGKCHIVWRSKNDYNSSGTDMDIFYRSIQPPISPLFLRFATTTPATGNTSTEFDFKIRYYHLDNTPPAQIYMYLDETQLEPAETNQSDTKYSDGKEYYCMVSNLEIGSHEYYFFATDGTITTKTRYYNKPLVNNTKPKIITQNNLTAIEDTYYEYSYEFIDMDIDKVGQDYTWEFETNASWLEFSTDLGTKSCTLSGTPTNDDVGIFSVDLMINDTMEFDQRKFSITVLDVNDKPDIITDNVLTTNEDELYKVIYEATDIDSSIEFQLWSLETNAIDWLSMNSSSGELRGKPCNDDVGFYWANVTVDDSKGGYDHTNFTLEVINVNDPPEIGTNDLLSATTGQMYEMDYDADG